MSGCSPPAVITPKPPPLASALPSVDFSLKPQWAKQINNISTNSFNKPVISLKPQWAMKNETNDFNNINLTSKTLDASSSNFQYSHSIKPSECNSSQFNSMNSLGSNILSNSAQTFLVPSSDKFLSPAVNIPGQSEFKSNTSSPMASFTPAGSLVAEHGSPLVKSGFNTDERSSSSDLDISDLDFAEEKITTLTAEVRQCALQTINSVIEVSFSFFY